MHGLSVDQEGNFYVAEVDSGRAQKYRPRPGANPAFLLGKAVNPGWKIKVSKVRKYKVQSKSQSRFEVVHDTIRRTSILVLLHFVHLNFDFNFLSLDLSLAVFPLLLLWSQRAHLQVVWVRVFGNVFGNTVYSAAIVVAVFMLGLGVGSYILGRAADRWYAARSDDAERLAASRLRLYRADIAADGPRHCAAPAAPGARLGDGVLVFPRRVRLVRPLDRLSRRSAAIAVVLLAPITLLMGGTLTLLIRHLVRSDLDVGGRRIALIYAVNTAGAAVGCFLTDFSLVPRFGLLGTQLIAVALQPGGRSGRVVSRARRDTSPELSLQNGPAPPTSRGQG